jgi:hypothetical protein
MILFIIQSMERCILQILVQTLSVIDSKTNSDKVTSEIMMKDTPIQIVSDENAMHVRGRHSLNANKR